MDRSRPPSFVVRIFGPDSRRGLALVTVLWMLVLLSLMAASLYIQ